MEAARLEDWFDERRTCSDDGLPLIRRVRDDALEASCWRVDDRWLAERSHGSDPVRDDPPQADRLARAQEALRRIDQDSREEGFEPPSVVALATAGRVLQELYDRFPRDYEVYPTSRREVAIEAPGGPGRGVLILLDPGGGAICFVTRDGKNRRARYDEASRLPDLFVMEAIRELDRP